MYIGLVAVGIICFVVAYRVTDKILTKHLESVYEPHFCQIIPLNKYVETKR